MAKVPTAYTVDDHFAGKDSIVSEIYDRLLAKARKCGPVVEDPKKTSIHLNRSTAFAGVQVRKRHLVLTIKADGPLKSPRIHKSEQASAHRWHHEIKLFSPSDLDGELVGWLQAAYELSG